MSADSYVQRAIDEVERELNIIGQKLRTKVSTPLASGYRPELEISPELDAERANYYQGLIGVLRWICELGRIDIVVSTALMSQFVMAPRVGHLEQVLHIFAYLKKYKKAALRFDDSSPEFDESRFENCDWYEYYPGAEEIQLPNTPPPRGRFVDMTCFVDADHAGCQVTRRSHTGVLIFVQRAPIIWYSKRQNTVESSTFTSEFVALRIATDMIEGLRHKLRLMGIGIEGPTSVFCDNESVVRNATRPESVLKKKHNAIAYHRVQEAQAATIIKVAWEEGAMNLADILTKPLPGPRLRELTHRIMWP